MNSVSHDMVQSRRRAGSTCLFLLAGLTLGALYGFAGSQGVGGILLGWSINPGFLLMCLTAIAAVIGLRVLPTKIVLAASSLFLLACLVEFLGLPRVATCFLGVLTILLGEVLILRGVSKLRLMEVGWLLIGSYMESVFIYNLLSPRQFMHFFRPGWTV